MPLPNVPYTIALVLMAAGNSQRFISSQQSPIRIKKQWLRIGTKPLWQKVLDDFCRYFDFNEIIITASQEDIFYMQNICTHKVVLGGATRAQSVRNALRHTNSQYVLVSDAARFFVDTEVLERLLGLLDSKDCNLICAVPYIEVTDTTFYKGSFLERESLKLIQTPQLVQTQALKHALSKLDENHDFSDESSAIDSLGLPITFVKGSKKLEKLTFAQDLTYLESFGAPSTECIYASGFDVHAFEDGKPMVLGGINIESSFGFKAHSDGDVCLHALSDAILGAINAGDIGEWFPDTQEEFKNADSKKLLESIHQYAQSVGYEVVYVDITILAQIPKISPYKHAMKESIAKILGLDISRISIKASTTENLGFLGRKEGLGVNANVTMRPINWQRIH